MTAKTEGYGSVDRAYANDTVINLNYIEKKDNYDVIAEGHGRSRARHPQGRRVHGPRPAHQTWKPSATN